MQDCITTEKFKHICFFTSKESLLCEMRIKININKSKRYEINICNEWKSSLLPNQITDRDWINSHFLQQIQVINLKANSMHFINKNMGRCREVIGKKMGERKRGT